MWHYSAHSLLVTDLNFCWKHAFFPQVTLKVIWEETIAIYLQYYLKCYILRAVSIRVYMYITRHNT